MSGHHDRLASFIDDVRKLILALHPSQKDYFEVFANEAGFGLSVIEEDINALPRGASILEVGAGLLLLSGYLSTQGFRVHALEPLTRGFSHFMSMQNVVAAHYQSKGYLFSRIDSTIEDYSMEGQFDYVFSINVFEHIQDVNRGLSNAYISLKNQGAMRVYCPNYHFPYEPHFNIPTLFSKRLTEVLFKASIMRSSRVIETKETWDGLNWISVSQVKTLFRNRFGVNAVFNRLAMYQIFERMLTDVQFSNRRSRIVRAMLSMISNLGGAHMFKYVPVVLSPVMDFLVRRGPSPPAHALGT